MTSKQCSFCGLQNRTNANFCRKCGKDLSLVKDPTTIIGVLDRFIGLTEIKKDLLALVGTAKMNSERKKHGLPEVAMNLSFLFKGNTGTGKTTLARYIGQVCKAHGVLSKGHLNEYSAEKLRGGEATDTLKKWVHASLGGVLLIEEVDKQQDAIGEVVRFLESPPLDLVVILSGLDQGMDGYFSNHPDDGNRIGHVWCFKDFSDEELSEILLNKLLENQFEFNDDFCSRAKQFVSQERYGSNVPYSNGWLVEKHLLKKIMQNQAKRVGNKNIVDATILKTLIVEDLPLEKINTLEQVLATLDELVGFDKVRLEIKTISQTLEVRQRQIAISKAPMGTLSAHMVITGNPGTGKTTLARKLGEVFRALGVLPKGHVVEVDRSKLVAPYVGQTAPTVNQICNQAMGGILFIDEAYTLKPEGGLSDSFGQEAIDTLLKRMEDDRGKFILVVAGYKEHMERFLGANEGLRSRFNYNFHLSDYNGKELFSILKSLIERSGSKLDPESEPKVLEFLNKVYEKRDKTYANGRTARQLFEAMEKNRGRRLAQRTEQDYSSEELNTFTADDLPEKDKEQTPEEIFREMEKLIGLDSVKNDMCQLYQFLQVQKKRLEENGKGASLSLHFIFSGNPGTGKTTVARILGKLFKAIGLLPDDKLVERAGKDLLGQYVGTTVKKVNELVDTSLGGVLFIDEAYTLTPEGGMDSFSKEAVDTLMKRLEDDRGRFICIAAGYRKEMARFLSANPGLPSRFNRTLHFQDYNPSELKAIYLNLAAKEGYNFGPEAEKALDVMFEELYEQRAEHFGNARDVRNLWELTIQKQASRLSKTQFGKYSEILMEDLPRQDKKADYDVDPMETLKNLIGMNEVKREIDELITFLKVEARRAASGGSASLPNLHMILTGNPGTGKTTVAKILGAVYKQMGMLKKGHVVEVDRSRLVAGYIGQTAIQTQKKLDEAMGGVFFLDEAYTLAPPGSGNDFGKEAIDTILKRMEDDRGKFIVLAAGYKEDMERFLASNDGLRSRFTRYIHFADYTPQEMIEIFNSMASQKK